LLTLLIACIRTNTSIQQSSAELSNVIHPQPQQTLPVTLFV
ncbi:unnamed protein product, partial [Brassica napus]